MNDLKNVTSSLLDYYWSHHEYRALLGLQKSSQNIYRLVVLINGETLGSMNNMVELYKE